MRLNHVFIPCTDVERSLAFYRGLGLEPIVIENADDGAPRYARLRTPDGEVTLSLERGTVRAPGSAADGQSGPGIYFECEDLEERVRALVAAGYTFVAPPHTRPWLWREAELLDPDGHAIRLYHAASYRLDPPWRLPGTPAAPTAGHADGLEAPDAGLSAFLSERNRGYIDAPIPSARDEELGAHIEALIARGAEARDAAASAFGRRYTVTLLAFAERMATRAVRDRRDRPVLLGLFAVGLSWREAFDVRAGIPPLGLLYDAAARAGADPIRVFREAQALLPDDVAPVFADFLTRPDLDGIAAEMGYATGADRDGFRYRRLWGTGLIEPEA